MFAPLYKKIDMLVTNLICISILVLSSGFRFIPQVSLHTKRLMFRSKLDDEKALDFVFSKVDEIPVFKDKVKSKSNLRIKELSGVGEFMNIVMILILNY